MPYSSHLLPRYQHTAIFLQSLSLAISERQRKTLRFYLLIGYPKDGHAS